MSIRNNKNILEIHKRPLQLVDLNFNHHMQCIAIHIYYQSWVKTPISYIYWKTLINFSSFSTLR